MSCVPKPLPEFTEADLEKYHRYGMGIVSKSYKQGRNDDEALSVINYAIAYAIKNYNPDKSPLDFFLKKTISWKLVKWMKKSKDRKLKFTPLPENI